MLSLFSLASTRLSARSFSLTLFPNPFTRAWLHFSALKKDFSMRTNCTHAISSVVRRGREMFCGCSRFRYPWYGAVHEVSLLTVVSSLLCIVNYSGDIESCRWDFWCNCGSGSILWGAFFPPVEKKLYVQNESLRNVVKSNTVFATTEATMQKEVWDMIDRIRGEFSCG